MSNALFDVLNASNNLVFDKAEKFLKQQLEELQKAGKLLLSPDHTLTGSSLELRVDHLLRDAGLPVERGRDSMEDFVVKLQNEKSIFEAVVIEVKSAKNSQPALDDLRQLDDWVFDLSGEETARKHGLGGRDVLAMATDGHLTTLRKHPSPHKGVFVFNGQVGKPFDERTRLILPNNQLEFAIKRNFCIISLDRLIELCVRGKDELWSAFMKTVGVFEG